MINPKNVANAATLPMLDITLSEALKEHFEGEIIMNQNIKPVG